MYVCMSRLGMLIFCALEIWHTHAATPFLSAGLSIRVLEYDGLICAGADTGLLRGEGIMHNVHAQTIDHIHFRQLMTDDSDAKAKKIIVLSSEIIEKMAKPPDILCIFCILWTKGRPLVQGGN